MADAIRIVDVRWTPEVNVMALRCPCGHEWDHRADRWRARCPGCGQEDDLGVVRERSYGRQAVRGDTLVIITGTRKPLGPLPVLGAIGVAMGEARVKLPDIWEVWHGACPGRGGKPSVDEIAAEAFERKGAKVRPWAANWDLWPDKAGPIRNEDMAAAARGKLAVGDVRRVVVIAVPGPDSKGTWDMVNRAKRYGLEVVVEEVE